MLSKTLESRDRGFGSTGEAAGSVFATWTRGVTQIIFHARRDFEYLAKSVVNRTISVEPLIE